MREGLVLGGRGGVQFNPRILECLLRYLELSKDERQDRLFQSFLAHDPIKWHPQHQTLTIQRPTDLGQVADEGCKAHIAQCPSHSSWA